MMRCNQLNMINILLLDYFEVLFWKASLQVYKLMPSARGCITTYIFINQMQSSEYDEQLSFA